MLILHEPKLKAFDVPRTLKYSQFLLCLNLVLAKVDLASGVFSYSPLLFVPVPAETK
ncbi:hypothetical protein DPMN_103040 [Dreissena polymorpha]|uniref:Uncharacterized protein n=1 Tax=Dreissena polymorpha TaxID=45954 RepID=A0A9D4HAA5_DREPO|nr:hypothetical protein DPMN_103040 [Dreissena polymorpha]